MTGWCWFAVYRCTCRLWVYWRRTLNSLHRWWLPVCQWAAVAVALHPALQVTWPQRNLKRLAMSTIPDVLSPLLLIARFKKNVFVTVLWPLYRTTYVSRHPLLTSRRFFTSHVLADCSYCIWIILTTLEFFSLVLLSPSLDISLH